MSVLKIDSIFVHKRERVGDLIGRLIDYFFFSFQVISLAVFQPLYIWRATALKQSVKKAAIKEEEAGGKGNISAIFFLSIKEKKNL